MCPLRASFFHEPVFPFKRLLRRLLGFRHATENTRVSLPSRVSLSCLVLSWPLITFKLLLRRFSSVGVISGGGGGGGDDNDSSG